MKICYICNEYPDFPHGGIGTVYQLLAEELVSLGHEVKVVGIYDSKYIKKEFEIKRGVEIYRLNVNTNSRFSTFWGYFKMSGYIKKWIKKHQIDIIECPDSYGIISIFAPFNRPLILRAHGNNTYSAYNLGCSIRQKTRRYEKWLYKKAYAVCAVSNYTAQIMQELMGYKKEIRVIYNGIDLESIDKLIEKTNCSDTLNIKIVFSGKLIKTKGVYELVKAIIILLDRGYNLTILLNGRDTIDFKINKSVQSELLSIIPDKYLNKFVFNGHVSREELFAQYKNCTLAIFPSYTEAFAMAPLESMACAKPTIYSNLCSGIELIENKIDGLLINPKSLDSIIENIEFILQNPQIALLIGNNGRKKVERLFSKKTMTQNTINYYEQITATFGI